MISVRSEVRVFPGPPAPPCFCRHPGAIAQLGERVLCKHEVVGSIPSGSTRWLIEDAYFRLASPDFEPCSSNTTVSQLSDESCGLSDIVKRKYIRLPREGRRLMCAFCEECAGHPIRFGEACFAATTCGRQAYQSWTQQTAAFPDVFEAKLVFLSMQRTVKGRLHITPSGGH